MKTYTVNSLEENKTLIGVIVIALVVFGLFLYKGWGGQVNNQIDDTVIVTGSFSCLPFKDPTPDDPCALGVKDSNDKYYALDISHIQDANSDLKAEDKIAVTGTLMSATATTTNDWKKYDIKGIIRVSTLLRTR